MTSSTSRRIGPYEITRELGRGGMGVVYLGRDTRLDRDVAIKALPEHLATDPDRLARFEREAKTLAQLNHPNVAGIYGIEEHEGARYLVLEFVEGETLAQRLDRGAMPVDEALEIAVQIAAGVEAAHEAGVIHRDLKPGNVIVTSDGKAKVLDFGLARTEESSSSTGASPTDPTITSPAMYSPTIPGVILGTAAYMSPEQARGRRVDKRTDIWSFGVLLYECLTGANPFVGETVTDSIGAIMHKEIDVAQLPAPTPPAIGRLLRRCLERNPKNRLHDIADARIVIDEVLTGDAQEFEASRVAPRKRSWLPWAIAIAGVATALVTLMTVGFRAATQPADRLTRTSILMPVDAKADLRAGTFALAPDGGVIVFSASDGTGSRLYVRELAEPEPRPLAGTEGALNPFWSPDSRHIAFFAAGALRRVPRDGGAVQTICAAKDGRGGAWSREGTIVFAADFRDAPLLQVPASGGKPTPATTLDVKRGEISHRFPTFLPDGRHFLFSVEPRNDAKRARINVASLDEVTMGKLLLEASEAPRFAPPNHLVFPRDTALMVQSLDLERLEMVGEAQLLHERPSFRQLVTSTPIVEVANTGAMLYAPVDPRPTAFIWIDRDGLRSESAVRAEGQFSYPAVSHSVDRVVVSKGGSFAEGSLWIFDLEHGGGSQITPRGRSVFAAIWSPDDRELAANLAPGNSFAPAWIAPESGRIREILEPALRWTNPTDVSADGRVLLYDDQTAGMRRNLGYLRLDDTPERTDYLTTTANEEGGRLTPDGNYIAYLSDKSGTNEVYVDTFPTPSRAQRVNTGGAAMQVDIRSDGSELFILAADGDRASLYACELVSGGELEIKRPQKLFTLPVEWTGFAPSPKGDRFLLLEPVGSRSPSLTLVNNWRSQLGPQR